MTAPQEDSSTNKNGILQSMLQQVEWKMAFKTALAAGITLIVSLTLNTYFKRPDTIISGLWATLAAIVVQQAHLGSTYRSAWIRFLGVLIGCLMGGFFTTFLGSNPLSLGTSIFLTVVICSMFYLKESLRIACLSVAVVMLLWGIRPETSPWAFALYRFLDSCLGIAVAVIVAHTVWPLQVTRKLSANVVKTMQNLSDMYRMAASLAPFSDIQRIYFRKLTKATEDLIWKNRQLLEDSKLELLSTFSSLEEWKFLFNHFDAMLDRISIMSRVYKEHLSHIVDEGLSKKLDELTAATEKYFVELSTALEMSRSMPRDARLESAIVQLSEEMLRFRQTKMTRQFNLDDVEGYFVFFYASRALAEELIKARKHVDKIVDETLS